MIHSVNVSTILLLAAVLLVSGITSAEEGDLPTFSDYQAKGFLSDYSKLSPEGGDSDACRYLDGAVDFSRYKKLLIDRIKVYFKEDSD